MTARKIAIVGFAPGHRMLAPWDDPEWEMWGCNDAWTWMPRIDRHFEIHSPEIFEWELRRAHGHVERLSSWDVPTYMLAAYPEIPASVRYPIEQVIDAFPKGRPPYFTSTIAYMLGLAIMEQPDVIGLWGIDMASQTEYAMQRPCCEWMVGIAEGRGIEVVSPDNCMILRGKLYGRGWMKTDGERLTRDQLAQRLRDQSEREGYYVKLVEDRKRKLDHIEGAWMECRRLLGNVATLEPSVVNAIRERADMLDERKLEQAAKFEEAIEALQKTRGAKDETMYWISQTPEGADPRIMDSLTAMAAPPMASERWQTVAVSDDGVLAGADALVLQEVV